MTAADEAYDRLHGVDGHTQAVTPRYTPGPTDDAATWACLACRANETREDVAQFEAPCEVHAVEMSRKAEQAERRAEDAEAEVERLRSVLAEVQWAFNLQCPPMPPEKYASRGAWVAHSWWNTVLGGILSRGEAIRNA